MRWSAVVRSACPACRGCSRPCTSVMASCPGQHLRARHRAVRKRLQCFGAHEHVDPLGSRPARVAAGGPRLFFDAAGAPMPVGTLLVNQPYADTLKAIVAGGADAFYGPIADRHRGRGQWPSDQSGRPQPRRSRRLSGQGTAGGLRALSRPAGLRHGTALLRRAVHRPDSWLIEPFDIATLGPTIPRLAHHRRRLAAGLRRPRALHRRQRFRNIPKGLLDPAYLKARSR